MNHPKLGELTPRDGSSDALTGAVKVGERCIALFIEPDSVPLEAVLARAATVVESLPTLVGHAERALTRDLLQTYNGGWNTYEVLREDEKTEIIDNPQLSGNEFVSKFLLRSVEVLGESVVTLRYDDPEELFWGHYVYVQFMEGLDAECASAAFDG